MLKKLLYEIVFRKKFFELFELLYAFKIFGFRNAENL